MSSVDKKLVVCSVGVLLCAVGAVVQFCEVDSDADLMYAVFMVVAAGLNYRGRRHDSPWLHCASGCIVIVLLDRLCCAADDTFWRDGSDYNALKASVTMVLVGTLLSFAVLPFRGFQSPLSRSGCVVFFAVLVMVGAAMILVPQSDFTDGSERDATQGRGRVCGGGGTIRSKRWRYSGDSAAVKQKVRDATKASQPQGNAWDAARAAAALAEPLHALDRNAAALQGTPDLSSATCPSGFDGLECLYVYYPTHLARAMYIAVWLAVSALVGFEEGRSLGAVLCAMTLSDYQPGGPGDAGRVSSDMTIAQAGLYLCFVGMWLCALHHSFLVLPCKVRPSVPRLTQQTKGRMLLCCLLCAVIGGSFIWAAKDPAGHHFAQGQEAWDVAAGVVATALMVWAEAADSPGQAFLAIGLSAGIANRAVGTADAQVSNQGYLGGCPAQYEASGLVSTLQGITSFKKSPRNTVNLPDGLAVLRIGYLLLFLGWGVSLIGIPELSWERLRSGVSQPMRRRAVFILSSVAFIWCVDQQYWGQLGFTAVLLFLSYSIGYYDGMLVAFVVSLSMLPGMTPCTLCVTRSSLAAILLFCCAVALVLAAADFVGSTRESHERSSSPAVSSSPAPAWTGSLGLDDEQLPITAPPEEDYSADQLPFT
eukprot:TRINITY_DN30508_c0_g1_i1.p1 TRINITY_DN30508_c0_g1~~TRINITY_DN30508_c0_g1_i1.p1  ORF type:complete len:670 (+),score=204.25 TRINITY_DN30508_c0_g1_i1:65-2011(+)